VQDTFVRGDVLADLDTRQREAGGDERLDCGRGCTEGVVPQLLGGGHIAEVVRVLTIEPDARAADVKSRPHAVGMLG